MKASLLLPGLGAALLIGNPALAQETPSEKEIVVSGETPAADPSKDPNEVVCKHRKQSTSRFTKKTCKTRKDWDELAVRSREQLEEMRPAQGQASGD